MFNNALNWLKPLKFISRLIQYVENSSVGRSIQGLELKRTGSVTGTLKIFGHRTNIETLIHKKRKPKPNRNFYILEIKTGSFLKKKKKMKKRNIIIIIRKHNNNNSEKFYSSTIILLQ